VRKTSLSRQRSCSSLCFAQALYTFGLVASLVPTAAAQVTIQVTTVAELIQAASTSNVGDTISVAAGVYELESSLQLRPGVNLIGAGIGQTEIRNASTWSRPLNSSTVENLTDSNTVDRTAYLIDLGNNTNNVRISGLTLSGPQLHGGIYGNNSDGLQITGNEFRNFQWAGVRTFRLDGGTISDNKFLDAGGRVNVTSGTTGGGVFVTFTGTTQISNNQFDKSAGSLGNYFGIKGEGATDVQISNNTINTNFAIEFPFRNDAGVVIRNNYLGGVVSIPKSDGGPTVPAGDSFRITENYFNTSYAIEGARDGLLVERNLFDFSTDADTGNLYTQFGSTGVDGPVVFSENLIKNPGRGILSSAGRADNFTFTNNHVMGEITITPRTEGLFGFRPDVDFSTIEIADNIFELTGLDRPLFKNANGLSLIDIENNLLTGISDAGSYNNPQTGATRGPTSPLQFSVGVNQQYRIDGFSITSIPEPSSMLLVAMGSCGLFRRNRRT
jgi:hypothetical protein